MKSKKKEEEQKQKNVEQSPKKKLEGILKSLDVSFPILGAVSPRLSEGEESSAHLYLLLLNQ